MTTLGFLLMLFTLVGFPALGLLAGTGVLLCRCSESRPVR